MTLGEALRESTQLLERGGVDSARLDAERLVAHALGLSRLEVYTQHDRPLSEAEASSVHELVERRAAREPLAYVLGEWGFRHLTLRTDARVLVPRPETEILVERALMVIEDVPCPRVLDIGTGSGAIALAIAQERPDARVTATDISADALALARENADRAGLRVTFLQADMFDGVSGRFDLVVSNPPYVLASEQIPPELGYEPREALVDRGQTARLMAGALRVLSGWLIVEVHEERAVLVVQGLTELGYSEAKITPDLAGRERVVEARWTP